jgi:alpha-ketoglutarate-dependent taurine dioxygenase
MEKFAAYLKNKEETQLITLPIKPRHTVFVDNRRMLHGRGELSTTSKRHLVRFYLRAA